MVGEHAVCNPVGISPICCGIPVILKIENTIKAFHIRTVQHIIEYSFDSEAFESLVTSRSLLGRMITVGAPKVPVRGILLWWEKR